MKTRKASKWDKFIQANGTWNVDAMSNAELEALAAECDKPWTGKRLPGRALSHKERAEFEAWQRKAQGAASTAKVPAALKPVLPPSLGR